MDKGRRDQMDKGRRDIMDKGAGRVDKGHSDHGQ
jgi:hypothetical protein